jgi:hypothetical protein
MDKLCSVEFEGCRDKLEGYVVESCLCDEFRFLVGYDNRITSGE